MPPSLPASQLITHVSAIGFATALSARALDPLIPSIAGDLAVDAASVALLSTAFALPFACVQPILGSLADMVGKIRLMVTCLAVIIVVSILSALAQSFAVLMLARIVCGMATGGIFPVGLAIIGDAVPVGERQVAIARWLAITIGGNLIGAAFAGMVGDLLGWRAVFWLIGACGAAALLNAAINLRGAAVRPPARLDLSAIPSGYLGIFANPRAKFCFAAVFLEGVSVFGLFPFVALLLVSAGEPRAAIAGIVIGGFSIGGVVYSLLVRLLTRRWQPRRLMIGGGVVAALAFLIVAANPPWPLQLAAFLVLGIGFYSLHGCIQVEATELSVTARGAATSLHSLFFFLGHATGPVLYGLAFAQLGAGPAVILGGLLMLFVGLMTARYLGRPRPVRI
jgi:MFS transporter, DHA1 family, inner membrane transport protein